MFYKILLLVCSLTSHFLNSVSKSTAWVGWGCVLRLGRSDPGTGLGLLWEARCYGVLCHIRGGLGGSLGPPERRGTDGGAGCHGRLPSPEAGRHPPALHWQAQAAIIDSRGHHRRGSWERVQVTTPPWEPAGPAMPRVLGQHPQRSAWPAAAPEGCTAQCQPPPLLPRAAQGGGATRRHSGGGPHGWGPCSWEPAHPVQELTASTR